MMRQFWKVSGCQTTSGYIAIFIILFWPDALLPPILENAALLFTLLVNTGGPIHEANIQQYLS